MQTFRLGIVGCLSPAYMHAVKPHRASSSSSCTMWNIYFFHAGNIINFLLARIYSLGNGRAAAGSFFNLLCFDIFFKFCIYLYKMNRRLAAVFIKTISSLYVQQNPNRALYSVRVAWLVGKRKFNLDKKRCDAFKYVWGFRDGAQVSKAEHNEEY